MAIVRKCNCGDCPRCRKRAYQAVWRKNNLEKARQSSRDWHEKNKGKRRGEHLERVYGITREDYAAMLESQGGKCAICRKEDPAGRNLAIDHDHQTGKVRSLLCMRCNGGLWVI